MKKAYCDICKKNASDGAVFKASYLSNSKMQICKKCMEKILKGVGWKIK
jgi:ribosome-binding protein aMBF1 (putative translation factor)